jgi:hypothetical protein
MSVAAVVAGFEATYGRLPDCGSTTDGLCEISDGIALPSGPIEDQVFYQPLLIIVRAGRSCGELADDGSYQAFDCEHYDSVVLAQTEARQLGWRDE